IFSTPASASSFGICESAKSCFIADSPASPKPDSLAGSREALTCGQRSKIAIRSPTDAASLSFRASSSISQSLGFCIYIPLYHDIRIPDKFLIEDERFLRKLQNPLQRQKGRFLPPNGVLQFPLLR